MVGSPGRESPNPGSPTLRAIADPNDFLKGTSPYRDAMKAVPKDQPVFEGYAESPTFRRHIGSLGQQGVQGDDVVKLDGIGGSAILARGDLFRRGLYFPPFVFEQ